MEEASRILDLTENTSDGMLWRFAELTQRELLFHPDDAPGRFNGRLGA